jgi:hypothetical protein
MILSNHVSKQMKSTGVAEAQQYSNGGVTPKSPQTREVGCGQTVGQAEIDRV